MGLYTSVVTWLCLVPKILRICLIREVIHGQLIDLVPDDYLLNISIDISSINLALYIFVLGLRPSKILQGNKLYYILGSRLNSVCYSTCYKYDIKYDNGEFVFDFYTLPDISYISNITSW